jgi:hypothetical protein
MLAAAGVLHQNKLVIQVFLVLEDQGVVVPDQVPVVQSLLHNLE